MSILVKDKTFYRSFLSMTAVIALQNLITFAVSLADNIMIGGYSQTALSGVAIVNQIQFLLQMLVTGIGNGIAVLGAQYWGRHQTGPIRQVTSIGLLFGMGLSLMLMALVQWMPVQVLSLLTNDRAVIAEGTQYLQIICYSYFFFAVGSVLLAALRSVETVKIGFVVNLTALVVNIFLNYGLIYGNFGMPALGTRGAAIATLISRIVEFSITVSYVLLLDRKIRWRPSALLRPNPLLFRDYIKTGTPLILSSGLWGIAMSVQTAILGRMGSDTIAANSIATTLFQVVSVAIYASSNSTSVIIGKTIGQGSFQLLKSYAKTLQLLFLLIGLVTGTVMFLCRDLIISLYAISPETKALTAQFITILSVTIVGSSYQVPSLNGIVTGGGDTHFVLINDLISQWAVVLPLSFLSAFVIHAPLWVTFFCLKIDQILKCIVAVIKVNRFRWARTLTR